MLLAFGGTRTVHRLTCAIEDAGWEIRDRVLWLYGQGFPKSRDISKAIDKEAGAERACTPNPLCEETPRSDKLGQKRYSTHRQGEPTQFSSPATPAAQKWAGRGTALKPAYEPVVMAMKPLDGTFAQNALTHGVAGINVDGCRIATGAADAKAMDRCNTPGSGHFSTAPNPIGTFQRSSPSPPLNTKQGRWPANVILSHSPDCVRVGTRRVKSNDPGTTHTKRPGWGMSAERRNKGHAAPDGKETVEAWDCVEDCPIRMLDEQSGERPASFRRVSVSRGARSVFGNETRRVRENVGHTDTGGASRFFYCAKASRRERNAGCEGLSGVFAPTMGNGIGGKEHDPDTATPKKNTHPTVKPLALMRWLVRLVGPPGGGVILDPFMGSGTTGMACVLEGQRFIGMDQDEKWVEITRLRIKETRNETPLFAAAADGSP